MEESSGAVMTSFSASLALEHGKKAVSHTHTQEDKAYYGAAFTRYFPANIVRNKYVIITYLLCSLFVGLCQLNSRVACEL